MRFIALAAGLSYFFLGCVPSLAYASGAGNTSPDVGVFVGNYGESFEYLRPWEPHASMEGPVEVVRFQRSGAPKADFKPERFTPDHLLQLLVIPKDAAGGMESLQALRAERRRELEKQGAQFTIMDAGGYWPRGTFRVRITRPYELLQFYAQDDRLFFILSSGMNEDIAFLRDRIGGTLSGNIHASRSSQRTPDGKESTLDGVRRRDYYAVLFSYPYLPFWRWTNGICLLLVGLSAFVACPRRVKYAAAGALVLGNGWAIAGSAMAAAIFWASGMSRINHGMFSAFFLAPLMPWILAAVAKRLGAGRTARVFWGSAVVSLVTVIFAVWMHAGVESVPGIATFQLVPAFAFTIGVLFGALFGLLLEVGRS